MLDKVIVGNVAIGGDALVVVQSMTNTDTSDLKSTVAQIIELADAGSEIVRITVDKEEAAKQVPYICEELLRNGYDTPIVGDFHYNGHILLTKYPDCAKSLAKYRINPGNVGFGDKKDSQFQTMIETAINYEKPVRIGVNWGSLDQKVLLDLMDKNTKSSNPKSAEELSREAMILSAVNSAVFAEDIGLDKIILSCKTSRVSDIIAIYRELAKYKYPLHLGLTEAGSGTQGIVSSTAALSVLLHEGIGDTIRVSITPEPKKSRTEEVRIAREILQAVGIRAFTPQVASCPGCGRTTSDFFQKLTYDIKEYIVEEMPYWSKNYKGVEKMTIAVMGCIVNGPGESKHADIGISLPGTGESLAAPVFIDGKKVKTLKGDGITSDGITSDNITEEFKKIISDYVKEKYVKITTSKGNKRYTA